MLPHASHMCSLPLNMIAADKWFSDEALADEATYTKWGLEYAAGATLAGLLAEHTALKAAGGASVFTVGALAA